MYKVEETVERRAVSRRAGQFLAGLSRKIFLPALIGLAAVSASAQLLAPPNDSFANAQIISGTSGSVRGSDINATAESGEPPHNGVGATNSIWYAWTAPSSAWYTFDTRGSTDPQGNDLNTVLGIYTNPPVDQLGPVPTSSNTGNPNDDDPTGGLVSRVDFLAVRGTVYYIAVDSSDGTPPGSVVLNWHNSPNSGTFKWATGIETGTNIVETGDGFPNYSSASGITTAGNWPFRALYLAAQGDGTRQLTVTRTGGFTGRVYVDVAVSSTLYTNTFQTNFFGTNIFITNYDASATAISFTNIYVTNFFSTNTFQDNLYGHIINDEEIGGQITNFMVFGVLTNVPQSPFTTNFSFTNLTCSSIFSGGQCANTTNIFTSPPDTNGAYTVFTTNVFCNFDNPIIVTQYVDSVVGDEVTDPDGPLNFPGEVVTLQFDDYQMSAPMSLPLGLAAGNGPDFTANLREHQGVNPTFLLTILDAQLDPLESPDLVPPTVDPVDGNASLNLLDLHVATPTSCETNIVYNFQHANYRVFEQNPSSSMPTIRVVRGGTSKGAASVSYRMNYIHIGGSPAYHTYPLEAGSDYAKPGIDTVEILSGSVSWVDGDNTPKDISVPGDFIVNDNVVEFNEDIRLQLFLPTPVDGPSVPVPGRLGNVSEATLTIVAGNSASERGAEQPAGAVDNNHNVDGWSDSYPSFNPIPGANGPVYGVAVQGDDKSVIVGDFTAFDTVPLNRIARMDTNGLPDSTFDPGDGANDFITSALIDASGKIVIGGGFTSFNSVSRYHVARLGITGALDTSFKPGFGADGTVWAMGLQPDGKIVIGGEFTSYDATNCNAVARLNTDGSLDTTFNPPSGANDSVFAIAVQNDGKILIGGQFTAVNGVARAHIARLNADGTLDTSFDPGAGTDDIVYTITVQPDGNILIGGAFSSYNFNQASGIARLTTTGALDTSFDVGIGADSTVYALKLQPDGAILVGGRFKSINETRRLGIARLLPSGWLDTSFMDTAYNQFAGLANNYYNESVYNENDLYSPNNSRNFVFSIGLQSDGNVMIGGGFQRVGGNLTRDDMGYRYNVARLIGGSTPGPGNIEFTKATYTADENSGIQGSYINLVRTNGTLGPVSVNFSTNFLPAGPGALTTNDFSVDGVTRLPITYGYFWPDTPPRASIGPAQYGYMKSDGVYGDSSATSGPTTTIIPIFFDVKDNSLVDGNRLANFGLFQPDIDQKFDLGGQTIPLGIAFGRRNSQFKVVDNDYYAGTFGFSLTNYSIVRGSADTTVTVTVVRTNGATGNVTLSYATAPGTALNGLDYVNTTGTLTFGPNVTSRSFQVQIKGTTTILPDRFFNVKLSFASNPGNYGIMDPSVFPTNSTVTIIDGNLLSGHLNFTSAGYSVGDTAGFKAISVARTGGSLGAMSVDFQTIAGTAVDGVNYAGTNGTLRWNSGDISAKTFLVPVIHDGAVTGDLTVNLHLSNPQAASDPNNTNVLGSLSDSVLNIVDEDAAGQVGFVVPNFNVMETAGKVHISVTRNKGVAGAASINFATTNLFTTNDLSLGYAQAGRNYQPTNGVLFFAPGEVVKGFDVPINYYPGQTPSEVFGLLLFNPSPATVTNNAVTFATVTVLDAESQHPVPGSVDTTYVYPGFNDFVLATALQPDGKLLAGGNFTLADAAVRNHIARLNVDGSVDTDFGKNLTGTDGAVRAIVSMNPNPSLSQSVGYSNGPIVIAGAFDTVNGVFRHKIARLNLDGNLDSTFNPGAGADAPIYALAQTFAGTNQVRKVLAAGAFGSFNNVPANGLVQLNDDGTVDQSFTTGGVNGTNANIYALAVQADGKIVIGGDFTSYGGVPHEHLARLNPDGSVDSTFNPDTGADGSVRAIVIQPDARILVGGLFTNVNGTALNHVARLNVDGSVDTSFNVGVGANDTVMALALDSQGNILVGGEFTTASGVTRNRLTRLASDGTVDPSINFGAGADNLVATIAVQNDDNIIIGGGFTSFDGIPQGRLARLFGGSIKGDGKITFSSAQYFVNENGTNALITLRRIEGTDAMPDEAHPQVITVDGTAVAGTDYVGVTNDIVFPRGETFAYVTVPVIDNNLVDGDRSLQLVLTNTDNTDLGPQPYAVLTIINDDSGVSFDAAQYRVAENTASGSAVIPVIRSGSTIGTMSVDVATVGGSALQFVNYIPTTNTIVFNDGESNKLFRVQVLNDGLVDGDQTVGLQLGNPQGGYLVSPNVATLTIAESSFGPGVLAFSQTNYSTVESTGLAAVTIVRTNGSTGPVSVTMTTTDGTAIAGQDYILTNLVVAFADGEISKTVYVRTVEHTNVQPDKTFVVTLSNPQGGATIGANNPAIVTILDDHMNFTFANPAYFIRQDAGTVILTVLRNSGTNGTATVNYSTTNAAPTNGVAVAGEDYTTTSGTLTFAPGEVSKTIFIPILDDGQVASDEQFSVFLSNPGPGTFLGSPSIAVVTIINIHSGLGFSSPTYSVLEGPTNAVITVNRTAINTGAISVGFSTADGTARAGLRYVATNGILAFANGQASASFTVPIIDNNTVDGDQTVLLNLFNPSTGVSLVNSNAVLTIVDNDAGIRFSSANYRVQKNGVSSTITVLRTTVTNTTVSVDYTTKDGTAIGGVNYSNTTGTLVFAPGETAKTFVVPILDNNIITGDKTVLLNLSNPSTNGVLVSPLSATLTIVEDNGSLIVPAGVALLSESGPVNGLIDGNETVSLYFAFRNTGGGDTTNLVATLLNSNGVANASAAIPYSGVANSASYGHLVENGPSVSQRFTFRANATNGQTITATFVLEDVAGGNRRQLGTGVFTFPLGAQMYSFTNSAFITINDSATPPTKASAYPSQINVSGVIGNVAKVTATFVGLSHTYPDDIDALLVGPNNQNGPAPDTLLMAADGGPFSFSNVRLTFDDSFPALPNESPITTGTNQPTLGTAASEPYFYPSFPPNGTNALAGPYPVTMSVFNGINPNGVWSLYIVDSTFHDSGSVNNGWVLNIMTGAKLDQSADLGISISDSPVPATVSNVVDYHITISNYGPAGSTNLVFTDVLPAGMTYLSNTCNCAFNLNNNTLTCPLAYLLKDGTQSFDIFVRTDAMGTFTNTISVDADQFDPDSTNSIASVVTEVDSPEADLGAAIFITPNPVLINNNVSITMTAINNGFSPATSVVLTNQLPVGLSLQSVSSSLGSAVITTNATGLVVVALGDLPVNPDPNTSPTVTITATATGAGTNLVSVRVASSTFDPLKGNNVASAKVEIDPPTLGAAAGQNGLLLTWPASVGNNFVVEQTTSLAPPATWAPVTDSSAVLVNGQYQIQVSSSNSARFFRLRAQ